MSTPHENAARRHSLWSMASSTFGERLGDYLDRRGIKLAQLASEAGMTKDALYKWSSRGLPDTVQNLGRIYELLGVSADEMIGIEVDTVSTARALRAIELLRLAEEELASGLENSKLDDLANEIAASRDQQTGRRPATRDKLSAVDPSGDT